MKHLAQVNSQSYKSIIDLNDRKFVEHFHYFKPKSNVFMKLLLICEMEVTVLRVYMTEEFHFNFV
jgi:hypothetical protein